MTNVQRLLSSSVEPLWPQEVDLAEDGETRVGRSQSEEVETKSPVGLEAKDAAPVRTFDTPPSEVRASPRIDPVAFPSLGSPAPMSKPRAYSDTSPLDLRQLRHSPFLVKVSKRKKKGEEKPVEKPPVWGDGEKPSTAAPLAQVQEEQKASSKFFNTWGLKAVRGR